MYDLYIRSSMTEDDKKDKPKIDLSKSDEMKINEDGSVVVGGVTYSSMEDFSDSIRNHEKEIKGE